MQTRANPPTPRYEGYQACCAPVGSGFPRYRPPPSLHGFCRELPSSRPSSGRVPGSSGSHATPPNFDTPIKDGDTYPSRTRGLRGVRSPSSRGVSRIRGYPPLPDLPEALPPLPTQMVGSTFPRVSRASSDLGSPWPPRSKILRGRRQWRSHRNKDESLPPSSPPRRLSRPATSGDRASRPATSRGRVSHSLNAEI